MNVVIYGINATGLFVGGLLTLKGYKVSYVETDKEAVKTSSIRLILPHKWFTIENIKYGINDKADFLFVCPDYVPDKNSVAGICAEIKDIVHSATNVVVFNSTDQQWKDQVNGIVTFSIPLVELSLLQEDQIEIFSDNPVFIFEKNAELKKFIAPLKQLGIKLHFTDQIMPFYNAFSLYNLIYLPVALANSTTGNFLSYPEGVKIIENIITEGIRIYEQTGKKLAALPILDPRQLVNTIQKKNWQFNLNRFLPDRNYNPLLQKLLLKKPASALFNQELLALAKEEGVMLFWNEKLAGLLDRIKETGFYKNPVELLKAVE